jgi:hypothetical protein
MADSVERIPAENWQDHAGHVARYRWAAGLTRAGEMVNDIACGVGYGATFFPHAASYRGWDRPGVPCARFPGTFYPADIGAPYFCPFGADVTCCFETLEHVADPGRLAEALAESTGRAIFVSVPVVPTVGGNPHHLHDFTREDIPALFPGFRIAEEWPQPEELSHVWMFERP